jgi:branched-chain amino acid transport system substrate-binding protein
MSAVAARSLMAVSSMVLVTALTGCQQSVPPSHTELKIVGIAQIDQQGSQVSKPANVDPADPGGGGNAACPPLSIAMTAALTGPDAALGINVRDGVALAVAQHNAHNPNCQVQLKSFDSEGDPQKAVEIAPQMIDDRTIIGLIGPGNSGETRATGALFAQADLAAITPSATNVTLANAGWKTFFRGLANDAVQGPSVANYLTKALGDKKLCVVDDGSDYGLGLAQAVRQTLGAAADSACNVEVKRGEKDFSAAVGQLSAAAPDAIFYGGYYAEAAMLVAQLRTANVAATFATGDAANDIEFVKQAGDSSAGAILSCPCAPSAGPFADAYNRMFGQPAGTYSAESYDLATIMLKAIDSGHITRPAMLDFIRNYRGQGVARQYQWASNGELKSNLIWMYRVQ